MAVRLFVGNLAYSTTEADLRTYFGAVAPPFAGRAPRRSGNRPSSRIRVRRIHRSRPRRTGHPALQRTALQRSPAGGQRSARAGRSRARRSLDLVAILPDRDRPAAAAASRRVRAGSARHGPSTRGVLRREARPDAAATSAPTRSRSEAAARRERRRATTSRGDRFP